MNTTPVKETILLGRGVLNWPGSERRSDRYGLITLSARSGGYLGSGEEKDEPARIHDALRSDVCVGRVGTLVAVILETRKSGHIGDFFRGIFPSTPNVGDEFELGTGKLFYSDPGYDSGELAVGVKPEEPRDSDWMDPRQLYKCHDQTVELRFVLAS
jgi:hypothetical protein